MKGFQVLPQRKDNYLKGQVTTVIWLFHNVYMY